MSNWISVKDRLPVDMDNVLTFDSYNEHEIAYLEQGVWWASNYENTDLLEVTHWMPLPELQEE